MSAQRFCRACGTRRIEGARFCGTCGAEVEALTRPSPPSLPAPSLPPKLAPSVAAGRTRVRAAAAIVAIAAVVVVGAIVVGVARPPSPSASPTISPAGAGGSPTNAVVPSAVPPTGGVRYRGQYQALTPDGSTPSKGDMETIRTIIQNRLNGAGVGEAVVQTLGDDRVVVELPDVTDPQTIRQLIGSTGELVFVPIPQGIAPPAQGSIIDFSLPPLFGGNEVDPGKVAPGFDQTTGERTVVFELKSDGAKKFGDYSKASVGQYFAIVLDGRVVSAPVIREPITDGRGQISGNLTTAEQQLLVTILRYGALPLSIRELSFEVVGGAVTLVAPGDPAPVALVDGRSIGSADAPVTLDAYEDFQCPACGLYSRATEPRLIREYVSSGRLRIVFHDFAFIGQESLAAATAARAAGAQGAFWPYHEWLFANQSGENLGGFRRDVLVEIARRLGLDLARFQRDLDDPATLAAVRAETAAASSVPVSSTPTLVVNGKVVGGLVWEPIAVAIDAALPPAPSPSASP